MAISIHDRVELIHQRLVGNDDKKYQDYLRAVYDYHAIEGSLLDDEVMAALIIRQKALDIGEVEIAEMKLATIRGSLRVVLRRYGASRKERRNSLPPEEEHVSWQHGSHIDSLPKEQNEPPKSAHSVVLKKGVM